MSTSISTYCVVFGCPNKGVQKDKALLKQSNTTVTFHKFPNKLSEASCERHKKWLKNINREHFIPKPRSVVCSLHFTSGLLRPNGKLLASAVPTLFMGSPPKRNKLLVDKGVQCEMGKEMYRTQPGVMIISDQNVEEFGEENNPAPAISVQEATSSSDLINKSIEDFPFVKVEDIKAEKVDVISPDACESSMDVQCNFCTCGECGSTGSRDINICCNQMGLNDNRGVHNCIVFDENFDTVVLDFHVVMTRLHTMIYLCPPEDIDYCKLLKSPMNNRLCRHVAYHQFRSWMNSRLSLGIDKIKLVPACVINAVRQRFPEDDNIYQVLFSGARDGQENKFEYFD